MTLTLPFDNSYARLPDRFYAHVAPMKSPAPRLIRLNRPLAEQLGLDPEALSSEAGLQILSGRDVAIGSQPIAQAYAGHQFGHFVPQLGDGRAILLGEVIDRDGRRRDLQLKGGGRTPFSRGGDGRAALGPVLREYVVSEAMAALGVPTTRALAAVTTGDSVMRELVLPGAVLTRVAASHIRVGTFQFFAARGDQEALRLLADHVIARHYPEAADDPQPYRALLDGVIARQAALIARWLHIGFIHGVMNTDNMSISGETIDYGPCAFLDVYDPEKVFSSIDRDGRYAYGNQPRIALWNLVRLAETLLELLDPDAEKAVKIAEDALEAFGPQFEAAYQTGLRRKLGLAAERNGDAQLAGDLLTTMTANQVDFTLFFRRLAAAQAPDAAEPVRELFVDPTAADAWLDRWRQRLADDPQDPAARTAAMNRTNPAYIPRNHRVEEVIRAAVDNEDFAPFERLVEVLAVPFEERAADADYQTPPRPDERVMATFCGT